MRELAFGPRQSGRTTELVKNMIEDMELHDKDVFVVAFSLKFAYCIRDLVKQMNGEVSRVKVVALDSLNRTRGIDPRNIYFDHTAYEYATSKQLSAIYEIEDRMQMYIAGDAV